MSDKITRSVNHVYTFRNIKYPSVTTILNAIDKSGPLMSWAARNTAEAALAILDTMPAMLEAVGPEGVVKALTSRSNWKRDEAAQLGTDVHQLADLLVNGEPLPQMTDTQNARVTHYAEWWLKSGWSLRLSEAMVVTPATEMATGWAGTFDLLARDADGKTVLADIKTGKGVYKEAVLQLAAYGMAKHVQPAGADRVYPNPLPDRYVILHVTADGVRPVEVNIGTAERMAFLACLELWNWMESQKGVKL